MKLDDAIFLSLGSNRGFRRQMIRRALEQLQSSAVQIVHCSSLYETAPVGVQGQPDFINIACRVETSKGGDELLDVIQEVETTLGRRGKGENEPRCIDIDILYHGRDKIQTDRLVIPHPRLYQRLFVLIPLAQIAWNFVDPQTGTTVECLLKDCKDQSRVQPVGLLEPEQSLS